jgi:hypothetical protein
MICQPVGHAFDERQQQHAKKGSALDKPPTKETEKGNAKAARSGGFSSSESLLPWLIDPEESGQ